MSTDNWFLAAILLVLAVTLVSWAWFTMSRVKAEPGAQGGFKDHHFEIGTPSAASGTAAGPPATERAGSARSTQNPR